MKRILIVIMTALLVTVFAAGAKQETPAAQTESPQASQSAQIANPWKDVKDAAEVKETTGLEMGSLPQGATDVTYSVLESQKLAQAVFTWKGDTYTLRMVKGSPEEDLSGMFVEFGETQELKFEDYPYTIRYNEGAEGASEWHDELTDVEYSVTMQTGATKDKLSDVSVALIPAG